MQKTDLAGEPDSTAAATTPERVQALGAALALLVLVLLVVLDLWIPPDYAVLTALFALAPLIACAVVPVRGTALIAGLAASAAATVRACGMARGARRSRPFAFSTSSSSAPPRWPSPPSGCIANVDSPNWRRSPRSRNARSCRSCPARAGQRRHRRAATSPPRGAPWSGVTSSTATTPRSAPGCWSETSGARASPASSRPHASSAPSASRRRCGRRLDARSPTEMDDYLAELLQRRGVRDSAARRGDRAGGAPAGQRRTPRTPAGAVDRSRDPGTAARDCHSVSAWAGSANAYVETRVSWSAGDRLLMYTDGLSEARDSPGEFLPVVLARAIRCDRVRWSRRSTTSWPPPARTFPEAGSTTTSRSSSSSTSQAPPQCRAPQASTRLRPGPPPTSRRLLVPPRSPVIGPTSDPPHTAGTEITTDAQALPAPPRHPRAPDRPSGTASPHARTSR